MIQCDFIQNFRKFLWNSQNNYKTYIEEWNAMLSFNKNSQEILEEEHCEGIALPDTKLNFKTELINTVLFGEEMNK